MNVNQQLEFNEIIDRCSVCYEKKDRKGTLYLLLRAQRKLVESGPVALFAESYIRPDQSKGSFLLSAQAWDCYRVKMMKDELPVLSKGQFFKGLSSFMLSRYAVRTSKGILSKRGTLCRGYRKFTLFNHATDKRN